eukprot:1196150-Prorocentrum_minimum.AAC.1
MARLPKITQAISDNEGVRRFIEREREESERTTGKPVTMYPYWNVTAESEAYTKCKFASVAEVNIGLVHAAKGEYQAAMSTCAPLETKYPDDGLAHLGTKRFGEAIRRLELAQKSPDGARLHLEAPIAESYSGLASELLEAGRPADAQHMAAHAIKLFPTFSKAYKVLGFSYRHLGLHEDGLAAFKRATQLSPQDPEGWANLALVQSHTGRSQDAVESFREAIRIHPTYIGAYVALGKHLQAIQHTQEAITTFEKALRLDPTNVELKTGIMQAVADACAWRKKEKFLPDVLKDLGQQIAMRARRPSVTPFDSLLTIPASPQLAYHAYKFGSRIAPNTISLAAA